MHKLHEMLEKIEEKMCEELNHGIDEVDTNEFGKVADIYKDLMQAKKLYLEACYYKHVVEAMEEIDPEDETAKDYLDFAMKRYYRGQPRDSKGRYVSRRRMYTEPVYHMTPEMMREHDPEYYRDMDRMDGRMYYTEPGMMVEHKNMKHDAREGRSGMQRRTYMETKEMHKGNSPEDKQKKMKELEAYMHELGGDITEMVEGASPEEKNMLKTKLQTLAQKIS